MKANSKYVGINFKLVKEKGKDYFTKKPTSIKSIIVKIDFTEKIENNF